MSTGKVLCNGVTHVHCNDGCSHAQGHLASDGVDEYDCCVEGRCSTIMQDVCCESMTHGENSNE